MKAVKIAAMVILMALCARGTDRRRVMVCIQKDAQTELVREAIDRASLMFAPARLDFEWHYDARFCRDSKVPAIMLRVLFTTRPEVLPGALGYALAEARLAVIFYDRATTLSSRLQVAILAHVIAHEMTHVLQGVEHHSETGIMKASWDSKDFARMRSWPMTFTALDLQLIDQGLNGWQRALHAGPIR